MVDGTQKAAPESQLRSRLAAGLAGFAGILLLVRLHVESLGSLHDGALTAAWTGCTTRCATSCATPTGEIRWRPRRS